VRPFEIPDHDPAPLARAAAVRSASERDPATRARELAMSPAERLRAGCALSRFAAALSDQARSPP